MSRIGSQHIKLPAGVTLSIKLSEITVIGPKGSINVTKPGPIDIQMTNDEIIVKRNNNTKTSKSLHGLVRSLLSNAITGVSVGFTKQLELHGIGYRAILEGNNLVLSVGYSHPVKIEAPEGIQFDVQKNTISISGIDKQQVGQIAAVIRETRKPEPYKGKGIRYSGEHIRRKAGKAAKSTAS